MQRRPREPAADPCLRVGSGLTSNNIGGQCANGHSPNTGTQTTIGLGARIPIFQGGLPAARIRQAQAQQGQVLEQVVGTERAVVQAARAAFASYDAAQKAIQAETVAVQANELALEGNRAEQSVGTRTIIEVLNAEQELLNSQVALVTAKRDAYVAGFQLLNAMGQAEAQDLGLDGGPLYDPLGNYRQGRGQLERLGERSAPPDRSRRARQPAGDAARIRPSLRGRRARIDPSPPVPGTAHHDARPAARLADRPRRA